MTKKNLTQKESSDRSWWDQRSMKDPPTRWHLIFPNHKGFDIHTKTGICQAQTRIWFLLVTLCIPSNFLSELDLVLSLNRKLLPRSPRPLVLRLPFGRVSKGLCLVVQWRHLLNQSGDLEAFQNSSCSSSTASLQQQKLPNRYEVPCMYMQIHKVLRQGSVVQSEKDWYFSIPRRKSSFTSSNEFKVFNLFLLSLDHCCALDISAFTKRDILPLFTKCHRTCIHGCQQQMSLRVRREGHHWELFWMMVCLLINDATKCLLECCEIHLQWLQSLFQIPFCSDHQIDWHSDTLFLASRRNRSFHSVLNKTTLDET